MESNFGKQVIDLKDRANQIAEKYFEDKKTMKGNASLNISKEFENDFFKLVEKVSLSLMQDEDNFYGYFLFQMLREIRFDLNSATGINFKGSKFVIYFNPIIFLRLNMKQMECSIKQEILHIIAQHPIRAKELQNNGITRFAVNAGMDVAVNMYLDNLPPYAITLDYINNKYNLKLEPYESFEYYVENIQIQVDLQEVDEDEGEEVDEVQEVEGEFDPEKSHDIWDESDDIDEGTMREFTEKTIDSAKRGELPNYLDRMIDKLKNSKGEIPWNIYLKKLMGTIESNRKKTITRRNRRQPNRLDLRGQLRGHKANVAVAIDTSGSISDEEFAQAIKEVLGIVKNYNHEITIIECDDKIRNAYKVKNINGIQERNKLRGATEFTPVIEYANKNKINLLVYFTDGKGENRLKVVPRGYRILWVISGNGDKLSLKEPYGEVKKLSKVEIKDLYLEISDVRTDGYSMNNQSPML
ncbi:MAG: vWA domain-containing protein [Sarcina sp.]